MFSPLLNLSLLRSQNDEILSFETCSEAMKGVLIFKFITPAINRHGKLNL